MRKIAALAAGLLIHGAALQLKLLITVLHTTWMPMPHASHACASWNMRARTISRCMVCTCLRRVLFNSTMTEYEKEKQRDGGSLGTGSNG